MGVSKSKKKKKRKKDSNKIFSPLSGLAIFLFLVCLLSTKDSPVFNICADKNPYLRQKM